MLSQRTELQDQLKFNTERIFKSSTSHKINPCWENYQLVVYLNSSKNGLAKHSKKARNETSPQNIFNFNFETIFAS
jgi:hypothetical protein